MNKEFKLPKGSVVVGCFKRTESQMTHAFGGTLSWPRGDYDVVLIPRSKQAAEGSES